MLRDLLERPQDVVLFKHTQLVLVSKSYQFTAVQSLVSLFTRHLYKSARLRVSWVILELLRTLRKKSPLEFMNRIAIQLRNTSAFDEFHCSLWSTLVAWGDVCPYQSAYAVCLLAAYHLSHGRKSHGTSHIRYVSSHENHDEMVGLGRVRTARTQVRAFAIRLSREYEARDGLRTVEQLSCGLKKRHCGSSSSK